MPLTEVMLTIEPPPSWSCMNELAAWAQYSGASRLSVTMDAENRGEAVAASADGEPPALLTRVSIRPKRVRGRLDHRRGLIGLPYVPGHEHRRPDPAGGVGGRG